MNMISRQIKPPKLKHSVSKFLSHLSFTGQPSLSSWPGVKGKPCLRAKIAKCLWATVTFESSHFLGFFPLQCLLMPWPFLWTTGLASLPKLELTITDQFTLLQRNQCAEMLRKKYITQRWHFCSHCQATWQCQNQGLSNHGSLSGKPHKPCSKRPNSLTEISKTAVTRSILEYPWVTFTLTTLACFIGDISWCFTEFCDAMPSRAVKGRQVELQPWEPVDGSTSCSFNTFQHVSSFNVFQHISTYFNNVSTPVSHASCISIDPEKAV